MTSTVISDRAFPRRTTTIDRPAHAVGVWTWVWMTSRVAALVSTAFGLFVLVGYLVRWQWAVELSPSLPPMYPNAALGFAVGGMSALLATSSVRSRQTVALVGFSVVGLGAGLTLALHIVGAGPTTLELLWPEDFVAATTPVGGRPVVESSFAFVCLAIAGVLLAGRWRPALSQALAFGTLCVGVAGIVGYLLGVDRKHEGSLLIGMALHTAIGLAALGASVTLARPTLGPLSGLVRSGPSAHLSRRLLAVMVAAPILLAAMSIAVVELIAPVTLAESFLAVTHIVALGALVMVALRAGERVEQVAAQALVTARALVEEAGELDAIIESLSEALIARPTPPDGWDLGYRQTAALGVLPGDTCQVLTRSNGSLLVVLIDVAGHGTTAALQALKLRTEIDTLWRGGHGIDDIADDVDRSVREMKTISTGLLLSFDPAPNVWRYVNAGHPPLMVHQGGQLELWHRTRTLFGVNSPPTIPEVRRIDAPVTIVAHSDGVSESMSVDRQLLSVETLGAPVRRASIGGAQAVADACMDAAVVHADGRLRDDAVVLVLQHL